MQTDHRWRRVLIGLALGLTVGSTAARAQSPTLVRFAAVAGANDAPLLRDSVRIRSNHWLEGALAGTVVVGAMLAYGLHSWCRLESSGSCSQATVGGLAWGSVIGFSLGGIVGGLIPKN